MKDEKGINLISVCLIAVILLVSITVCICVAKETEEKRQLSEYISQMKLIQEKVNWVRSEYKVWENYNPNESGNFYAYLQTLEYSNANSSQNPYIEDFNKIINMLSEVAIENWNINTDPIITNYCYFSPTDLKKHFDLENINLDIIINFHTGNVISRKGVKDGNNVIYRQYDSKLGNNFVLTPIYNDIEAKLEVVENYGLSQKVKISLKENNSDIMNVYYYSSPTDESKKKCSNLKNYIYNYEENAVYFNIENSGDYRFIVEDTNFVQYPQIEMQFNLCNEPILLENMMGIYWDENGVEKQIISNYDSNWYNYSKYDFRMANAKTEDGNYWVWVPRYLYKETTEGTDIEFVTGITNVPTNNKVMNGYEVQKAFSENGEISGFWISKFQGNVEDKKINFKPGKTLTVISKRNIQNVYNNWNKNVSNAFDIMTENELDAALRISKAVEITISNNLVHYAGGAPKEEGFKENLQYSSTNNIYGIYDLFTSENELTRESSNNETGRFRITIHQ